VTRGEQEWAVRLFRLSVLKQRKLFEIRAMLGSTGGRRCLDLGSDNGVVSLLLRQGGGEWASADLTEEAVSSIRDLVGTDVHQVTGGVLPFPDGEFHSVVVVDMIEHLADDQAFVSELARITKPGGLLVVNTPHLKFTLLRSLRHQLGLTDARHGHLRPGYSAASLRSLLTDRFVLEAERTYSRFFSELVDTLLNLGLGSLGKKDSSKGMVVTRSDLHRHRRLLWAYSLVYPLVWLATRLDALVPASGYMLIVRARRV
jgi:SAM-dependent methyltransferase